MLFEHRSRVSRDHKPHAPPFIPDDPVGDRRARVRAEKPQVVGRCRMIPVHVHLLDVPVVRKLRDQLMVLIHPFLGVS